MTNKIIKIERVNNNKWGNPQYQVFMANPISDKLRHKLNDKFETHKVKSKKTSEYESQYSIYIVGYFMNDQDMYNKINTVIQSVTN